MRGACLFLLLWGTLAAVFGGAGGIIDPNLREFEGVEAAQRTNNHK